MGLNPLNIDLPPMSAVVAERKPTAAAVQLEREIAESAREMTPVRELLCRFVEADNPFGIALKFYDVAYLDETFNEVLKNGNRVVMSVEVNRYDRPVAYYFTAPRYDVTPYAREGMERVRVPAENVIHCYLPFEHDGQVRGVPWAHAAMWNLRKLGQFEEAALINDHVAACSMGFVILGEALRGAAGGRRQRPRARRA